MVKNLPANEGDIRGRGSIPGKTSGGGDGSPLHYSCLDQLPYDYTAEVMNRFKGLDLVDRMPEKLWMEVCNTVQESVTKSIPKKKKCKKAKWLSEENLQITKKRREAKVKGEKKRTTQLNAVSENSKE